MLQFHGGDSSRDDNAVGVHGTKFQPFTQKPEVHPSAADLDSFPSVFQQTAVIFHQRPAGAGQRQSRRTGKYLRRQIKAFRSLQRQSLFAQKYHLPQRFYAPPVKNSPPAA